MARIAVAYSNGIYRASVSGALSFRDLGRFERACGSALEQPRPPLIVRLQSVTSVDESARLFLRHLANRGVVIMTA
jgi:hypothetical protein